MFLNKVLRKKEQIEKLTQDIKSNSCSEEEIKTSVEDNILDVCNKIKSEISSRTVPTAPANFLDDMAVHQIQNSLDVYPDIYKLAKGSVYYDVKANPQQHLRAFYMLVKVCEENDMESFNCFPLRKGFIPSYMTIDTKILNYHILKNKNFTGNKVDIWGNVINLIRA
ncbi:hypothetical protein K7432_005479 [Basidiobolus ranarum]|uniref:Uncharacterized protein n=1 Tax=Basidiobolus ranarum TaxID=34480 RepID=A0ABR2WWG3_9FUNG